VGIVLALMSSAMWGTSDFLGGTASRRLPALAVVVVSEAVGLIGVLVVAAAVGAFDAPAGYVGWGLLGAVSGVVGITAFYRALAGGTMGVVAPIAATGVIVPVAVGVIAGDRPSIAQGVGVAVAIIGVILASGPELRGARHPGAVTPLLLAGVAALGFGLFFVCMDHGARVSIWMTLVVMRAGSVVVLVVAAAAVHTQLRVSARDLPLLCVVGGFDVGANVAFAVASKHGLLSIVSVLSSLYPVVTVVLARFVHDERLRPVQLGGVITALAGVALIASGGAG
jgi:drug/metabolite transporter (DMT)-like permease